MQQTIYIYGTKFPAHSTDLNKYLYPPDFWILDIPVY